ncbi:MAG: hypothetical protein LBG83_02025 [Oscillospiraceae bacterium]|nr:hypothetical protein [Oscillospiraceae bacterium]
MLKKNYFLRAAVLLLALCTLTASVFLGSGTMAKYYASAEGTASARVAKFNVVIDNKAIEANQLTFTGVPIWDLVVPDDTGTKNNQDPNVKQGTGTQPIIAPGTKLVIDAADLVKTVVNNSEVDVRVKYQVQLATNSTPLTFAGGSTLAVAPNWTDIFDATYKYSGGAINTTLAAKDIEGVWAFGTTTFGSFAAGDTADTVLGVAGTATCNVNIRVWVEQVD